MEASKSDEIIIRCKRDQEDQIARIIDELGLQSDKIPVNNFGPTEIFTIFVTSAVSAIATVLVERIAALLIKSKESVVITINGKIVDVSSTDESQKKPSDSKS